MAFLGSLLGIMGQLGRVVPNYVQGYRQAWQDNWNDANQYNQVQRGQLANLFAEAAFPYEFNMLADRAAMSRAQANQSAGNFGIYAATYPWQYQASIINAQNLPRLTELKNQWAQQPGSQEAAAALNQYLYYNNAGVGSASNIGNTLWGQNFALQQYQNSLNQANAMLQLYNSLPVPSAPPASTQAQPKSWQQEWAKSNVQ